MSASIHSNWLSYHLFLLFYVIEWDGLSFQLQVVCINYKINSASQLEY